MSSETWVQDPAAMAKLYEHRDSCPCCGSSEFEERSAVRSDPPAETLALEELGEFLSGYTSNRVWFSYVRCTACTMMYCPIYFSQAQLDSLYVMQPENMAELPLEAREKTNEGYFRTLARYSRLKGGYLEFGSDIGLFAKLCAAGSQFDHYWLYEPNRGVHKALADNVSPNAMTIQGKSFSPDDVPASRLSTAVMIHVLDHLLEPRKMLESLINSLEPGGVLFIVTHNVESVLARGLGRRWPPFTMQHPQLFAPKSMRQFITSLGMDVITIEVSKNFFPILHLVKAGLTVLGIGNEFIEDRARPLLGLKLGNIATVARKPA